MKPTHLLPQALSDRKEAARFYREKAGQAVAERMVAATKEALRQIERQPGIGSPRIGGILEIPGLRSWGVGGFPLVWFYFERDDCLLVVRLLGERQDILNILGEDKQ